MLCEETSDLRQCYMSLYSEHSLSEPHLKLSFPSHFILFSHFSYFIFMTRIIEAFALIAYSNAQFTVNNTSRFALKTESMLAI